MDEGKGWPAIFVLFLIMAGAFLLSYFDKIDKASAELETSKAQMEQSQRALENSRQVFASRSLLGVKAQAYQAQIQAATVRLDSAERKNEEAEKTARRVEGEISYLIGAIKKIAEKAREETAKIEIPELRLQNGQVLKNMRLRKIEGNTCSYIHSEGIGSMQVSELPSAVVERIQAGPDSIMGRLEILAAEMGMGQNPGLNASASDSKPQLLALRRRITDLESRIASTTAHKNKLEAEVREHDLNILKEQGRNGPTFNLRTLRDVAEGNAGMSRVDLNKLETELKNLRRQEQELLNSRP